ncbi:Xylose isomerase domain-containing protein [Sphingobium herbicidovorans NBRC 16415]|uniref:Xylose isomerase domain-containing protein n=1 Tax=Sphingobium herbicidovorans (strain ATCC 700291 / DSM 11019 / CCUG 56400 / KCTC 2939 / LMG 18315 / NBRC 16415 / MH) TaxID=1219045 RepID=A0A086P4J0_SPHHM|nr:sugar phosphate isomerase/epimerase [Sphingobium herbicidovorans]KFG88308.1 Xylose isomerase domain-containing protein [Sphingobium herbicidovorans NBRC 16415]
MTHDVPLGLSAPPFAHVPLLERLVPARDAGFSAISLMPGDVWALESAGMAAPEIAARIADHGLALMEIDCTACWLPGHRAASDDVPMASLLRSLTPERVVETAARIGAPSVTAVEMMGVDMSLDEAAEAFAYICDIAAPHGVKVHIEFLPFGGIPDLASAWAIVQAAGRPNGGLTLDSWHFFRSGSDFDLLSRIPGSRIHTVQINDAPAQAEPDLFHETMNGRLVPGQGSFNLTRFVRTLDQIGSTAPISIEIFSQTLNTMPMAEAIASWAPAARAIIRKARETDDR